jgi:hypothetical protein
MRHVTDSELPRSLVTGAATTKARGDFGATLCQEESEGR